MCVSNEFYFNQGGHTYCASCFNNLNTKTCPCCLTEIETTLKNWAIINIIPKPKLPQIFHDLKDLLNNGGSLLNHFDTLNKQIDANWNSMFSSIKNEINSRAEELIERIKTMQFSVLNQLNKHENEWLETYKKNLEFEKELNLKCKEINSSLNKDEINMDEAKLNEFKVDLESNYLNNLNEKINFLEMNYLNNKLLFKKSTFRFEDTFLYNDTSLIGQLLIVEDEEESLDEKTKPTKYNRIIETYSEIESILVVGNYDFL
jgi:hypothetical protein